MAAADNLDTLAKVKAALEHKLITTEIAEALRRKILQLAAVIVAPVTTVQQEDPTGRAAKEVRLALQVHIGTADRPAMGQKFYNAVFVTPVEELVRTEIATLLSGTPLRNSLADMFRVTGAGEVPTALNGTDATHQLAKKSAREWLIACVAPYAAWEMSRSNGGVNRDVARSAVITQLTDDDAASVGLTLLTNLSKISKSGTPLITEKKPANGNGNSNNGNNGNGNGNNGSKGNQGKQNQNQGNKRGRDTGNSNGGGSGGSSGECFFCGTKGHRQKECTSYAKCMKEAKGQ